MYIYIYRERERERGREGESDYVRVVVVFFVSACIPPLTQVGLNHRHAHAAHACDSPPLKIP